MTESPAPQQNTGKADIVIGIVPLSSSVEDRAARSHLISSLRDQLEAASSPVPAVLVHPPLDSTDAATAAPRGNWRFLPDARLMQDRSALAESLGASFRAMFDIAGGLEARACAVITSDLSTVTPEWIHLLTEPVIGSYDLVTPCYTQNAFDGVMNRAIVYPMMRALYGKRVRNPLGPDFGISGRLLARMTPAGRPKLHPLVSLVPEAVAAEMKICQVHLGQRVYPSLDWANLSPFLSQVLTALFLDVERFAPWWQRARGSEPIAELGGCSHAQSTKAAVDPAVLMQGFQTGVKNLVELWGAVIPPSTLVVLRKLAAQGPIGFRMTDETWARIVFDFALAHRLRPATRAVTLRSFTPLYMAWVASYAFEIADASPSHVEQRIEELCVAFEKSKPYFVSRWRWPDRFDS